MFEEEELEYDPIIAFYLKLSKPGDDDDEIPLFSETMLRLSFKEVFGSLRKLAPAELELYRKLLLLHYSRAFCAPSDLSVIMTCFDENMIILYLQNSEEILEEWLSFFLPNLYPVVYKAAITEMLYEYAIRYVHLFKHISALQIKELVKGIGPVQKFLDCNVEMPKQFYTSFNSVLRNKMDQNQDYAELNEDDLDLLNIYQSIKHKLSYFVVKRMSKSPLMNFQYSAVDNAPPIKKMKKTADLNEDTTIEVVNSIEKVFENTDREENEINSEIEDNKYYVYNDCDDDQISLLDLNDDVDNHHKINELTVKIPQQFDESYYEERFQYADESSDQTENVESNEESQNILDYSTAIQYLAKLQEYAIVNEHFEAIELLDSVDIIFRKKNTS